MTPATSSFRCLAGVSANICRHLSTEATSSFTIYSWGRGAEGALGNASGDDCPTPKPIATTFRSALKPTITAGMWHSGAVVDGLAYLWGKGKGGRLGLGDEASRFVPVEIDKEGFRVQSLALGGQHSAAISKTGELLTWGYGGFGCLGHAEFPRQLAPKPVETLYYDDTVDQSIFAEELNPFPLVSAGGSHTLVADRYGRVFACGRDEGEGRLGLVHSMINKDRLLHFFLQVPLDRQVTAIAAGGFASYALTRDGEVYSWGANGNGELGLGAWAWSGSKPRCIEKLTKHNIVQLSAGGFHAAALSKTGTVFTWGMGRMGALGHGETSKVTDPTRVAGLRNEEIVKVCCGPTSTYAVASDGRLFAWGNNTSNSLGLNGKAANEKLVLEPALHEGHPPVIDVAAGSMHGLALVDGA